MTRIVPHPQHLSSRGPLDAPPTAETREATEAGPVEQSAGPGQGPHPMLHVVRTIPREPDPSLTTCARVRWGSSDPADLSSEALAKEEALRHELAEATLRILNLARSLDGDLGRRTPPLVSRLPGVKRDLVEMARQCLELEAVLTGQVRVETSRAIDRLAPKENDHSSFEAPAGAK